MTCSTVTPGSSLILLLACGACESCLVALAGKGPESRSTGSDLILDSLGGFEILKERLLFRGGISSRTMTSNFEVERGMIGAPTGSGLIATGLGVRTGDGSMERGASFLRFFPRKVSSGGVSPRSRYLLRSFPLDQQVLIDL